MARPDERDDLVLHPASARVSCIASNFQGTVRREVRMTGRGLHTGKKSTVAIHPAAPGQGIVFRVPGRGGRTAKIPADWRYVRRLPLCTCLSDGSGTQVRTTEHLLAACYGCGVDNAEIFVSAPEIPLLDGSAKPFADLISEVGIINQQKKRKTIRITKVLGATDGPRWVKVEPQDGLRIAVQTYFKPFGRLPWWERSITRTSFLEEVAPARTYGLLSEGLAAKLTTWFWPDPIGLGVNARNAVTVFRGRVVTPGGLRYPDEYSRHRVVDWIGDLMLAGVDIQAKFTCFSPTHHLARQTLEAIFTDPTSFREAS